MPTHKNLNINSVYVILFIWLLIIFNNGCRDKNSNSDVIYFNPNIAYGSLTDHEGNVYKTVVIGSQTWMAENLRVTRFRNGDPIPYIADTLWDDTDSAAYCNYNNDANLHNNGRLYNWHAVNDQRSIAPEGWHVPTESEWTMLINYLGEENAGGKLKEAGFAHWYSPNTGADNGSGFTALPSGTRYEQNFFFGGGASTGFWSKTETDSLNAWNYSLSFNYEKVGKYANFKTTGFSVRCVRD